MFAFQWNALRVGDRVMVHDDLDPGYELIDGIVKLVEMQPDGASEVAIRLDDEDSRMLRVRRHVVHLLPLDRRFACWRCDVIAAALATSGTAGEVAA